MTYEKQNFKSGDTLYASQLNAMDEGIASLNEEMVKSVNGAKPDENGNVVVNGGEAGTIPPGSITFDMLAESTLETLGDGITETGTAITIDNKKDYSIVAEVSVVEEGTKHTFTHSGKNLLDMSDKKTCNKNGDSIGATVVPELGMIETTVAGGNGVQRLIDKKIYVDPDKYYTYSGVYSPGGVGRLFVQAFDADGVRLSTGLKVTDLAGGWAGGYLAVYNGWYAEANPVKIKVDSSVAYIKLGAIWMTSVNGTDYTGTVQSYKYLQLEEGEAQTDFSVGLQTRMEITNEVSYIDLVPGSNVLSADGVFKVRYNPYIRVPKNDTGESGDYATPQMYGAKADGVTDDTAAIQETLDNNKNVFFSEGTYLITAPLIVKSGTTMYANNAQTAKIKAVGCDAIHVENGASNGEIRGLAFVGDDSDHFCVKFAKNVNWTFDRLKITHFGNSFFYADGDGYVSNIYITNGTFAYGGAECVFLQHVLYGDGKDEGTQVNSVVIEKCMVESFKMGIAITGTAISIRENVIEFCEKGIVVDTTLSKRLAVEDIFYACVLGMTIDRNYMEGITDHCIYVKTLNNDASGHYGFMSGINISGNYLRMAENTSSGASVIKFARYKDMHQYDEHAAMSIGHEIDGVTFRGNYCYPQAAYIVDCGGFLPKSCVFELINDGSPYMDKAVNKGNATVNGWPITKKKLLYAANGVLNNATADASGASIDSGGSLTLLTYQTDATSIDLHFTAEEATNVTVQLYAVRADTLEKVKTVEANVVVETDATYTIDSASIVNADSGKMYYTDIASLELVISSDGAVTVDNPIVTHLA